MLDKIHFPSYFRNSQECNDKFSDSKFIKRYLPEGKLLSSQFCSGNERTSTTPGDLGGPSIIRKYDDGVKYYLIGVVSGVALNSTVSVFTNHKEVFFCTKIAY